MESRELDIQSVEGVLCSGQDLVIKTLISVEEPLKAC